MLALTLFNCTSVQVAQLATFKNLFIKNSAVENIGKFKKKKKIKLAIKQTIENTFTSKYSSKYVQYKPFLTYITHFFRDAFPLNMFLSVSTGQEHRKVDLYLLKSSSPNSLSVRLFHFRIRTDQ